MLVEKDYQFKFQFNIYDLSAAVRNSFLLNSATLRITGEVTIPVKFFGIIKISELTIPYELQKEISSGL